MFASMNDKDVRPAHELRASDRVRLFEDNYNVTAYSVPTPGMVKLWVSPETDANGALPHNPLQTLTVNRNCPIPNAK